MPIRLNLLAETQAVEEMRRHDPVKRAIWCTALVVALMLAWSSSLQLQSMLSSNKLNRITSQINQNTNAYQHVLDIRNQTALADQKLAALHQLTTNRFLYGTLLDAMQQTTVDRVRLLRFRTDQSYVYTEAVKGTQTTKAAPAKSIEKTLLTLDGIDSSLSAGDSVSRLREVLTTNAFLTKVLSRTNPISLKSLSPPQVSPDGKSYVQFTFECRFPDNLR
jgi:hypothetical protein